MELQVGLEDCAEFHSTYIKYQVNLALIGKVEQLSESVFPFTSKLFMKRKNVELFLQLAENCFKLCSR